MHDVKAHKGGPHGTRLHDVCPYLGAEDLRKPVGVSPAMNTIPAPAESTASVELAGMTNGAMTAKPNALEPWTEGKAGCGHNRAPSRSARGACTRLGCCHKELSCRASTRGH